MMSRVSFSGASGLPARGSRIVILHDEPHGDSPDLQDGLIQRDSIREALLALGYEPIVVTCTLDLEAVRRRLIELSPVRVFNLVESLGGTDRLMPLATLLLDGMGMPYSGCPTEALLATNDKPRAKQRLRREGLPTAHSWTLEEAAADPLLESRIPCRVIIKSEAEHASVGIDDSAIVAVHNRDELVHAIDARSRQYGNRRFAEQFIDGREFNLSLLAGEVLPCAEIEFLDFAAGKPRIVGYAAKWIEDAPEYGGTPRTFSFPETDTPLLARLQQLAARCWQAFELRGAARVDFRVDQQGEPWILEVNANPCLTPYGGFMAACEQAGLDYTTAIGKILADQ